MRFRLLLKAHATAEAAVLPAPISVSASCLPLVTVRRSLEGCPTPLKVHINTRRWMALSQQRRSFSNVEISPSNHGTKPLKILPDPKRLHPLLVKQLIRRYPEFENPTPIQAHAIPLLLGDNSALSSKDVMLRSATGSGKTLALGLPLFDKLFRLAPIDRVPFALIINPTRELAQQTAQVLQSLVPLSHAFSVALATGGVDVASQKQILQHAHIVVGTPGRILQFLDDRTLSLHHCQFVAIDEADRLLDMGFEPQLQRIARALRRNQQNDQKQQQQQQTVLCSATFPPAVQRLGSLFLRPDYFFVAASSSSTNKTTTATTSSAVGREPLHTSIQHQFVWYDEQQQQHQQRRQGGPKSQLGSAVQTRASVVLDQIQEFLKTSGKPRQRILVFCNTKVEAKRLATFLKDHSSYKILLVTGDQAQPARQRALDIFRRSNTKSTIVVVATDVAARGLDVPGIGLVLQAEASREYDTYVHRVGRTGRAGATGTAVTLLSGQHRGLALDLVEAADEISTATKNVDIPSWLRGLAHVARAQRSVEVSAIAAGTGGGDESTRPSSAVAAAATEANINDDDEDNSSTSQYSAGDFRSQADRGSWGRDRDTSFQAFEEEAYGNWDAATFLADSKEPLSDEEHQEKFQEEGSAIDEDIWTDDDSLTEEGADSAVQHGDVDDVAILPVTHETGVSFARPRASKGLQDALMRMTGSGELGDTPNRSVMEALARVRTDPRLRYEYIGMFPFEDVVDLLVDRKRDKAGTLQSGMLRVLMVAEKPSIAKSIAEALSGPSGPRQRRGISRALPVYEFTTDKFAPASKDPLNSDRNSQVVCVVTSVVGHIFSLGFTPSADDSQRMDPIEFFDMPVVKQEEASSGKLRVVDHLRALAGECDHLVLWLDCDAEGENIAFETIGVTRRAFDQKMEKELSLHQHNESGAYQPVRRIHRARFSAITREALQDAFQNIGEPNSALSRSVDTRQELDLRVGVAMSRLLTWRCVGLARRKYSDATKLVSYGPCQTPTLSFCVDRAHAIEAFESQVYWKVKASASFAGAKLGKAHELRWKPPSDPVECTSTNLGFRKRDKSGKQFEESATLDKETVDEVLKHASLPGSFLQVNSVLTESERVIAPAGLNTVTLLSAGSKSMGMSPKQVMNVAEKLYTSGFISYPRTETTRYDPTGFDVRKILVQHANHPEWGRTAVHLLRTRFSISGFPPVRGKDAGDHPPITCLRSATREQIGGGAAWRVYEFVARTMLASFSDDLRFSRSVAELALVVRQEPELSGNNEHLFEMETVIVDSLGFAGACPWVLNDIGAQKKDDELEFLVKGMRLLMHKIRSEKKRTRPPAFLQEHELIELMDQNGVGTDASMATHVNNIVDRGYVVLCDETGVPLRHPRPGQPRQTGRYLVPTPLGMALMHLLGDDASSSSAETTNANGVALLARPAIRARMESECKLIAEGKMDKDTCLQSNLAWFRTRYQQLADSLTHDFLKDNFAPKLCPLKDALQYWRRRRAFEAQSPTTPLVNQGSNRELVPKRKDEYEYKKNGSNRAVRTLKNVPHNKNQQSSNRTVEARKALPDKKNVQPKEGESRAQGKTKKRPRLSKLITKG